MVVGAKPRHYAEPIFVKFRLTKLIDINKYFIDKFMHQYYVGKIPEVFTDYTKKIQDVYQFVTQNCIGLYSMRVKTEVN